MKEVIFCFAIDDSLTDCEQLSNILNFANFYKTFSKMIRLLSQRSSKKKIEPNVIINEQSSTKRIGRFLKFLVTKENFMKTLT